MKRIIKRKTPSGNITIIIRRKKSIVARCAICKKPLQGIKKYDPWKLSRVNKTQKRVSRIYGGNLCHKCLENLIKEKIFSKYLQK